MPTFKPKNTKKILVPKNTNTTLDCKHNEFLDEFKNNKNKKVPI